MAKQTGNVVTYGLSGKIGDLLVFRRRDGQTIVSKAPESSKKPLTAKQVEHQRKFRQAVLYAQAAVKDEGLAEIYEAVAAKKKRTPFTVAVADFFNAPEIEHIDLSKYTGNIGDTIRIEVADDVVVKSVELSIVNADGSVVEEGNAVSDASGHVWTYTATQENDNLEGDKITVSISDLPENSTEETVEIGCV
jgi:hypothetical protein